jgi:hypothetical protein
VSHPIRRGWASWPRSRPRCGGWPRWWRRANPPEAVFAAVAEEVGQLFRVELATLFRYEPGRTATSVTTWGPASANLPVGGRWPLEGHNVTTLVFETGRPVRIDRYADRSSGPLGAAVRETGIRSAVGTPVIVEGRLWGVTFTASTLDQPLPPDTETRLASFTELVATAIANTESRAALARLAEEQAALRRVATLVAQATPPEQVLAAVAEEVGPAPGGRLHGPDPVRSAGHDHGRRRVDGHRRRSAEPGRQPVRGRRPEREHADAADGPARPAGRLRRRHRQHREHWRSGLGFPLIGRGTDQRRGAAVGPDPGGLSPATSSCRPIPRRGWPPSPSWWRRRSRTPRAVPLSPGWRRSRPRCGGWPRWWRTGRRRSRCSRRSPRSTRGWFRSTRRPWRAWSLTVRSLTWPAGAGQWTSFPSVAGGPWTGTTSPQPCSRPAVRPESRARPVPPARSPISSVK